MNADTKKGLLIGLGIPLLLSFGLIFVFALPNIMAWMGPDPPMPEITYGEFPFRIEYEVYGEVMVVEDTIICEFDRVELAGDHKIRRWKSYLASNGERYIMLYAIDATKKICCSSIGASYFMGDGGSYSNEYPPGSFLKELRGNTWDTTAKVSTKELLEQYGIRFISWEYSEPIVNTFK